MTTDNPDRAQRPDDGVPADIVELAVPAQTAYVSVLRSTAAALASRLDFTLDEIEDLRIAVDEASALLLAQAVPGSQMSCTFRLAGDELVVSVGADCGQGGNAPQLPATDSFAWMVLTALVGPVDAEVDEENHRVSLTLTKRAEAVRKSASKFAGEVHDLDKARHARAESESESGPTSEAKSEAKSESRSESDPASGPGHPGADN